jgi:hypothetical protein
MAPDTPHARRAPGNPTPASITGLGDRLTTRAAGVAVGPGDVAAIRRANTSLLAGTPWRVLAGLATLLGSVAALEALGVVPRAMLNVVTTMAGYGALLATALAWAGLSAGTTLVSLGLLGGAALLASLHPIGAVAYVAPVLQLVRLTAAGRLRALGLGTPCPSAAFALGALTGVCLGAHLLVSAVLTLGYRPRLDVETCLSWVFFDLGAHLPATEMFFRGALFNRAQRRWSLGAAMTLTTAATVARYLIDPLLPHVAEVVLGSVLYLSLLSAASCWLYWRYGTLVPGLAAAFTFFAAYRTLSLR